MIFIILIILTINLLLLNINNYFQSFINDKLLMESMNILNMYIY